jgi:hypothetical protein
MACSPSHSQIALGRFQIRRDGGMAEKLVFDDFRAETSKYESAELVGCVSTGIVHLTHFRPPPLACPK